jgi:hypothetical protein
VLFINADAEYLAARGQNYLLPEHVEKIASTYEPVDGLSAAWMLASTSNNGERFETLVGTRVVRSKCIVRPGLGHELRFLVVGASQMVSKGAAAKT